ncbi:hypothetical protein BJ684DRAFT_18197 [Piptocephalis cylindrospora]|uniref:NudC domain-containing protein 1 n=1 Tax=Piptocephalis cylindrospora TaxID=1907219 RepID=A0A4P9Y9G2_9FUNG|nr:hypothetical protein BJ684DRAFT_18197 [Piptocephalis cylindrospora]|eukprot:RKP15494.1 hypothetical protein BJ684DRAFT_18197 [Piptocephalis cylindrospora]
MNSHLQWDPSSLLHQEDQASPWPFLIQASHISSASSDSSPIILISGTNPTSSAPVEVYFVHLTLENSKHVQDLNVSLTYRVIKGLRGQDYPEASSESEGMRNIFPKDTFPGTSYTWSQNGDRICLSLPLPSKDKGDVHVGLGADALSLHSTSRPLPRILPFYDRVSSESRWSIREMGADEGRVLEVNLIKVASLLRWPHIWKTDDGVMEEGIVNATYPVDLEDDGNEEAESSGLPALILPSAIANSDGLHMRSMTIEDDDAGDDEEDESFIYPTFHLWSLHQTRPISTLSTGSQGWLGEALPVRVNSEPEKSFPGLFVRYDIDGLIYTPTLQAEDHRLSLKHTGTVSAFGYIRSSKTEARFVFALDGGMSDCGIIVDMERRAYLYTSPSSEHEDFGVQNIAELGSGLVMGWGVSPDHSGLLLLTEASLTFIPLQ